MAWFMHELCKTGQGRETHTNLKSLFGTQNDKRITTDSRYPFKFLMIPV